MTAWLSSRRNSALSIKSDFMRQKIFRSIMRIIEGASHKRPNGAAPAVLPPFLCGENALRPLCLCGKIAP